MSLVSPEGSAVADPHPAGHAAGPLVTITPASAFEMCRRPTTAGPGWEAALAQGNRRAWQTSHDHLVAAVPTLDRFLSAAWLSRPWLVEGGAGLLGGVDVGAVVDEVMSQQHLPPGRAYLMVEGEPAPLPYDSLEFGVQRPRLADAAAAIAGGGGLVITALEEHDRELNRAVEHLDRVSGFSCRVDGEIVGTGGLSVQSDGFARILVAVEGGVHVDACEPTTPPDVDPPLPASLALDPGEAVAIPPGWGHRLAPTDAVSLVAAIAVPSLTVKGMAIQHVDELGHWPLLRSDLPLERHAPHLSYAGSVYEDGLDRAVAATAWPEVVDRILARLATRQGGRWTASLTASIAGLDHPGPTTTFRVPLPGGIQVGMDPDARPIVLHANRRRYEVTSEAVACAIGRVADGAVHPIADLTDGDDVDGTLLLGDLLRCGIAEVVTP